MKKYTKPAITIRKVSVESPLLNLSFDPTKDSQSITPSDEEYDDEFATRGTSFHNVWDD